MRKNVSGTKRNVCFFDEKGSGISLKKLEK